MLRLLTPVRARTSFEDPVKNNTYDYHEYNS